MNTGDILHPLREPVYRRIWSASILSNFGHLIQGVGAAWAMMRISGQASMVALVQTALMLPLMIWSIPAGAIADMYDKRKVALCGLGISLLGALIFCAAVKTGLISPPLILAFCFLIGSGMALYSPAWQTSVAEQVSRKVLSQAIALNAVSYNIARSLGPAIGGLIVGLAGVGSAFMTTALLYVPIIIVLLTWKRPTAPARLPPERIDRAILSGVRYAFHSPTIRVILIRTFLMGALGGSLLALMALVARDLIKGDALLFGVLLAAFGVGSIFGAVLVPIARQRYSSEATVRGCAVLLGVSILSIGVSRFIYLSVPVLAVAGATWMLAISTCNVGIQSSSPRWVSGRVLAGYQASVTGGVAVGAWLWGRLAQDYGVAFALYASGSLMILSAAAGSVLRIEDAEGPLEDTSIQTAEPDVSLALSLRSGPIIVEHDYDVPPSLAREYYRLMQSVRRSRARNGAYGWSLARDISNEALWTERYHCPTWLDYLHQRSRATESERQLQIQVLSTHPSVARIRVRRLLERPFGSVRWTDKSMDVGVQDVLPVP
jgi:MFS family permease